MINAKDLYTHSKQITLSSSGQDFGVSLIEYEIREYNDIRNLSESQAFIVTCTQRLIVPNSSKFQPKPEPKTSFNSYPAILSNTIDLSSKTEKNIITKTLIDYSPKTINSSISSEMNNSAGEDESSSKQHSSGSSVSQTNTYGGSASIGVFDGSFTGGLGGNYSHSTTHENSLSNMFGNSAGHSNQSSNSSSMSIKDWASYGIVDLYNQVPIWTWGQEYPWDVLVYKTIGNDGDVELPDYVKKRLFDSKSNLILPPSQLSLFGVNLVSKACWFVYLKDDVIDSEVVFNHSLNYITASHRLEGEGVKATMNSLTEAVTYESAPLDFYMLALDPITTTGTNGAVIGFIPNKFSVKPDKGSKFQIKSANNNLLIRGVGFNEPMKTDFSCGKVELDVYFKILDTENPYEIALKCWKTSVSGCEVKLNFNNSDYGEVIKYIDSLESEGGENNLLNIGLRNKLYSSSNYHDYLKLGINKVTITITPLETDGCGFYLRALAIN